MISRKCLDNWTYVVIITTEISTVRGRPRKEETTVVSLRIPKSLHQLIREIAIDEDRSLNGQIVRALREWLQFRKGEKNHA